MEVVFRKQVRSSFPAHSGSGEQRDLKILDVFISCLSALSDYRLTCIRNATEVHFPCTLLGKEWICVCIRRAIIEMCSWKASDPQSCWEFHTGKLPAGRGTLPF